jgi:hypothetical protein
MITRAGSKNLAGRAGIFDRTCLAADTEYEGRDGRLDVGRLKVRGLVKGTLHTPPPFRMVIKTKELLNLIVVSC